MLSGAEQLQRRAAELLAVARPGRLVPMRARLTLLALFLGLSLPTSLLAPFKNASICTRAPSCCSHLRPSRI